MNDKESKCCANMNYMEVGEWNIPLPWGDSNYPFTVKMCKGCGKTELYNPTLAEIFANALENEEILSKYKEKQ